MDKTPKRPNTTLTKEILEKSSSLRSMTSRGNLKDSAQDRSLKGSVERIRDLDQHFIRSRCGSFNGESFMIRDRLRGSCNLKNHISRAQVGNRPLAPHLRALSKQNSLPLSKTIPLAASISSLEKPDQLPEPPKRFNNRFHNYRFVVIVVAGLASGLMLLVRLNVSIALLQMVNRTELMIRENPDMNLEEVLDETGSTSGEFIWNNEIQQAIMSYYMFAYTLPQMPCTKLAQSIGSRLAMPISLVICAVATLLTPWAAYMGWQWVIVMRLINGLGATPVFPLMLDLIQNWMPTDEIFLGLTCAQMIQSSLVVCSSSFAGYLSSLHWSYAFYVPGTIVLVFAALWPFLITDSADDNWLVSEQELDVICGCAKPTNDSTEQQQTHHHHKLNSRCHHHNDQDNSVEPKDGSLGTESKVEEVGWTRVLTNRTFYAFVVVWGCHCVAQNCFLFVMPLYLSQFLGIGVSENGFLCSCIMSGILVSIIWPHQAIKFFHTKLNLSDTVSRRLCAVISAVMVSACALSVGLFHRWQILLFSLSRCFAATSDVVVTGSILTNYSKTNLGSLTFSMINTVSNLCVVFGSSSMGYILDATGQSREGWLMVYGVVVVCQVILILVFCTLIKSEPIDLSKGKQNKSVEEA